MSWFCPIKCMCCYKNKLCINWLHNSVIRPSWDSKAVLLDNQKQQMRKFCLSTNSFKNSNKLLINAVKHKSKNVAWKGGWGLETVVVGCTLKASWEIQIPLKKSKHVHTRGWILQPPSDGPAPVPSHIRRAQRWLTLAQWSNSSVDRTRSLSANMYMCQLTQIWLRYCKKGQVLVCRDLPMRLTSVVT